MLILSTKMRTFIYAVLNICAPFSTPVHICDYSQVMRIHFSIIQYTIRAKQNESSVRGSV